MPTSAVGRITEPTQAEQIVGTGEADAVCLARELLRTPCWPFAHKVTFFQSARRWVERVIRGVSAEAVLGASPLRKSSKVFRKALPLMIQNRSFPQVSRQLRAI